MQPDQSSIHDTVDSLNRLSEALSQSYRDLEARAAELADELARTREERERLSDRLAALTDALPGALLLLDAGGRVRGCNASADQWFDSPNGQRWPDFLTVLGGCLSADGQELALGDRTLAVSVKLLEERQERIVLLSDISERRRLQASLDRHRRLASMGEMAARLAHQVRTPLSSALLYANHLAGRELAAEQQQRFAQRVVDRLRELEHMTRDMLGFVQGGCAGSAQLAVDELLDAVEQQLIAERRAGRCLVFLGERGGLSVRGDRQALIGALCNLIQNAWQTDPAVRVVLEVRRRGQWIEFWVEDDGPGVAAADAERIFEPFVSLRSGGTGLGLAVARSVADAHRGSLRLEPHAGGGAIFVLTLPLISQPSVGDALPRVGRELEEVSA